MILTTENKTIENLITQLGLKTVADAKALMTILAELPANTKNIIVHELGNPQTLDIKLQNLVQPGQNHNDIIKSLTLMARLFIETRSIIKKQIDRTGSYTLDCLTTQQLNNGGLAGFDIANFDNQSIKIAQTQTGGILSFEPKNIVKLDTLPTISSLSQLPGHNIITVGIGGGSDCVQAAQMSHLLNNAGKKSNRSISVRRNKTESQSTTTGNSNENRSVENHGGEVYQGVYIIKSNSTGTGRFLENIPVTNDQQMFLIIDDESGQLPNQVNAVINHIKKTSGENIDTILGIDTGGDVLFGMEKDQATHGQSPDRDVYVMNKLKEITTVDHVLLGIIGTGIDTPDNAQQILIQQQAVVYPFNNQDKSIIMNNYENWDMIGNNDQRFGKTPLALQQAIIGNHGLQCLPIPSKYILDHKNPRNPFVYITQDMAGLVVIGM